MSKRISLREFQESLVRRLSEVRADERRSLLGVQAGHENWLFDLTETGEILPPPPLSTVPLTRPWYRGLANVRGTLYGIIDLSSFHDGPLAVPSGQARLLLVGARHGVHAALLVSRASGLRSRDDFEPDHGPADARPWVKARLRDVQNRLWLHMDIPALLNHPSFLDAGL